MQDRVKRKEWSEFQDTGLLVIVIQILHIFEWGTWKNNLDILIIFCNLLYIFII